MPATAPNTQSTLVNGNKNITSTSLSTHIIIKVNGNPVGAVQVLSISQRRGLQTIDEVGTDGHIDLVPNKSTDITGNCNRIRFDRMRIAQAFSRGFVHPQSQVYPFDIDIWDIQNSKPNSNLRTEDYGATPEAASDVIVTTIKNVWIAEISMDYRAENWVISDTMQWQAETIFTKYWIGGQGVPFVPTLTQRANTNVSQGYAGSIETTTDSGKYRGSMDAGGIIKISDAF